jgi:hypothetical protein
MVHVGLALRTLPGFKIGQNLSITYMLTKRYGFKVPSKVAKAEVGVWLFEADNDDGYQVGIETGPFEKTLLSGKRLRDRLDREVDLRTVYEAPGLERARVVDSQRVYLTISLVLREDPKSAIGAMMLSGYLASGFMQTIGDGWCHIKSRAEGDVYWPETAKEIDRHCRAWENLDQRWQVVSRRMRKIEQQFWKEAAALHPGSEGEIREAVRFVHERHSNVVSLDTLFEAEQALSDGQEE